MSQAVLSPAIPAKPRLRFHYAAAIFVGAFLLFQIQPIIGKYFLPWFGGMASVWTTCMLFFQVLLLGGYLYSHLLSTKLRAKTQAAAHTASLALAAIFLILGALFWRTPLLPSATWRPVSSAHPLAHLLFLLALAVGLPYLVLSSTGPLLQNWFSCTHEGQSPYRLYALSNFGSLLGLISYPILVEPVFGLHAQGWIWCAGYAIFLAASLKCTLELRKSAAASTMRIQPQVVDNGMAAPKLSSATQVLWFLLAALPSVMLLATTNLICQEIAVIPFLWVVPLSLYLVTLIICFDNPKWYRREIFHPFLAALLPLAALAFLRTRPMKPALYLISVFCAVLFACCMVCHGELVRLRPSPTHLTRFYLLISAGGAAGGVFVAMIAPNVFRGYWEFQTGLVGCVLLAIIALVRDRTSWWYWPAPALGLMICFGIGIIPHLYVLYLHLDVPPDIFYTLHYYGLLTIFGVIVLLTLLRGRTRPPGYRKVHLAQLCAVAILACLTAVLWQQIAQQRHNEVRRDRNFYGSLTIYYYPDFQARVLLHGQTSHGYQLVNEPGKPTSYYGRDGGIGLFMGKRPPCPGQCRVRYGLIGMGAGTLAAYGRDGEVMRYYEINPRIIDYSLNPNPYFTFIHNSAARIEVVSGDARLSLERELHEHGSQGFDLLVVDAFNSDSIPVHLLTREAMQVYLAHLRSADSVIAFHVSNRTLDLRPVLLGLALDNHLSYLRLHRPISLKLEETSDWVLMSRNRDALPFTAFPRNVAPMPSPEQAVFWTDDYSNLFQVLDFNKD